jgi:hypothetical protein
LPRTAPCVSFAAPAWYGSRCPRADDRPCGSSAR